MHFGCDPAPSSWNTLLLASDGSPASGGATEAAIALAKPLGARAGLHSRHAATAAPFDTPLRGYSG